MLHHEQDGLEDPRVHGKGNEGSGQDFSGCGVQGASRRDHLFPDVVIREQPTVSPRLVQHHHGAPLVLGHALGGLPDGGLLPAGDDIPGENVGQALVQEAGLSLGVRALSGAPGDEGHIGLLEHVPLEVFGEVAGEVGISGAHVQEQVLGQAVEGRVLEGGDRADGDPVVEQYGQAAVDVPLREIGAQQLLLSLLDELFQGPVLHNVDKVQDRGPLHEEGHVLVLVGAAQGAGQAFQLLPWEDVEGMNPLQKGDPILVHRRVPGCVSRASRGTHRFPVPFKGRFTESYTILYHALA